MKVTSSKLNNLIKLSILIIFLSIAVTSVADEKANVSFFMASQSYSNILPVKQLIKDNWQSTPSNSASHAFTQNEIGVRSYWQNFSFTVSKRYDHFLYTNKDTAHVFYLDKKGLPLNTQNNYQLDLAIQHQRSNGVRLGYKFNEANLPDNYEFLAECTGTITVNKGTSTVESIVYTNAAPFKFRMFQVAKVEMTVTYTSVGDVKTPAPLKEDIKLDIELMGQPAVMTEVTEYSAYKK